MVHCAAKTVFLSLPLQVTKPHSCDQHFSVLTLTCVRRARLLCLSILTTLAHITFSVGVITYYCARDMYCTSGEQHWCAIFGIPTIISLAHLIGWACFLLTSPDMCS